MSNFGYRVQALHEAQATIVSACSKLDRHNKCTHCTTRLHWLHCSNRVYWWWQCVGGNVVVAMCWWQCDDGNEPAALWRWQGWDMDVERGYEPGLAQTQGPYEAHVLQWLRHAGVAIKICSLVCTCLVLPARRAGCPGHQWQAVQDQAQTSLACVCRTAYLSGSMSTSTSARSGMSSSNNALCLIGYPEHPE